MPQVQYQNVFAKQNHLRGMPTPKKMSSLDAWWKEARRAIPEIPQIGEGWEVQGSPDVSLQYIKWTLVNGVGERAHVVINRTAPILGR